MSISNEQILSTLEQMQANVTQGLEGINGRLDATDGKLETMDANIAGFKKEVIDVISEGFSALDGHVTEKLDESKREISFLVEQREGRKADTALGEVQELRKAMQDFAQRLDRLERDIASAQ